MALRVRTAFTGAPGSPWVNTMHFPGAAQADANTAAAAVRSFWAAIQSSFAAPLHIQVEPEVEQFTDSTGVITAVYNTETASLDASGSGEPLPYMSQAIIRLRTGVFQDGREIRGRIYVPALTEGHNLAGVPSNPLISILNTAMGPLLPLIAVYQRPRAAQVGPPVVTARPGSINPATAFSVAPYWGVLRSRRD